MPARVELPVAIGRTQITILSVGDEVAAVQLTSGEKFHLPRGLLPAEIQPGQQLSLQIAPPEIVNQTHEAFAQRLLEDIINAR